MNRIKLLDNSTINKIAAGEVVERPSSVVKELVENSIDAGATAITVEIKDGGTTYIRITDNGCGIPEEDVKTAFLRHATSKIRSAEDLEGVFSLGFRGEALASIAAVSRAEMITKTRTAETGTRIRINGGILDDIKPEGAADGTTITIEDIFYNVPARRKFLKKASSEAGYITDSVMHFVLGHPEISFKYINNGTTIIHTSGNNDLRTAVYHVYGKDTAFKMLDISAECGEMKLTGLIGRPELSRANRSYENLFINGRFIKNAVVSAAAEEAYKTRLMIGKFPVYVLSMQIEPTMVDVNVHPAKLEVRFRDEEEVYRFVYDSIVNTFSDKVLIRSGGWESKPSAAVKEYINRPETIQKAVQQELGSQNEDKKPEATEPLNRPASLREQAAEHTRFDRSVSENDRKMAEMLLKGQLESNNGGLCAVSDVKAEIKESTDNTENDAPLLPEHMEMIERIKAEAEKRRAESTDKQAETDNRIAEQLKEEISEVSQPAEFSKEKPFFDNYRIVGQVFGTYWIVEQNSSMFVIDQHAAHERILFEQFYDKFRNGNVISQDMLVPERLILSGAETEILEENRELFEKSGFGIEQRDGAYYVKSVPYIFDKPATASFLMDMIDTIKTENIKNVYDSKLLAIATMACKAAVKGGDSMTHDEAEEMIKRLLALNNPFSCPHGRPTVIELTQYELEKKFKRIQ
ncbi:MAG: DNA mismatch repair endonuclease MutL [Clostridia bacterium]|nr:DNA mismatch repair endonuclease MutL [Clostridia bacterium]